MEEKNYFNELNSINVSEKIEKKNGLNYLSWCYAWGEVKKRHPDANYVIYENTLPNGYVVNYFTDGHTAWVKTGVIINGIEHIEQLPVMDYRNQSIPLEKITSFNVNTTIQRSLTKAIARHGLGLYIYAGEDLPEDNGEIEQKSKNTTEAKKVLSDFAPKPTTTPISAENKSTIVKYLGGLDMDKYNAFIQRLKDRFGVGVISELTNEQAEVIVKGINNGK